MLQKFENEAERTLPKASSTETNSSQEEEKIITPLASVILLEQAFSGGS